VIASDLLERQHPARATAKAASQDGCFMDFSASNCRLDNFDQEDRLPIDLGLNDFFEENEAIH
jgi:hypothetical protein